MEISAGANETGQKIGYAGNGNRIKTMLPLLSPMTPQVIMGWSLSSFAHLSATYSSLCTVTCHRFGRRVLVCGLRSQPERSSYHSRCITINIRFHTQIINALNYTEVGKACFFCFFFGAWSVFLTTAINPKRGQIRDKTMLGHEITAAFTSRPANSRSREIWVFRFPAQECQHSVSRFL